MKIFSKQYNPALGLICQGKKKIEESENKMLEREMSGIEIHINRISENQLVRFRKKKPQANRFIENRSK